MSIKHLKKIGAIVLTSFSVLFFFSRSAMGLGIGIDRVTFWGGNGPDGQSGRASCKVSDLAPWDIESLTLYGSDGWEYHFDIERDIWCHYKFGTMYTAFEPYYPPEDQYGFVLRDKQGQEYNAGKYFTPNPIDWVDMYAGVSPTDEAYVNTTTPTLNWSLVSDETASTLYYRINVRQWRQNRIIYTSNRSTNILATIPVGALSPDTAYEWQVQAFDDSNSTNADNFSSSDWISFYTGDPNQSLSIDSAFVYSRVNADRDETLFGVKIIGPAPYDIRSMTVTDPNGFSYQFDPTQDYKDEIYFHSEDGILSDSNYSITVIDDRDGATDSEIKAFAFNRLPIPEYTFSPFHQSYIGTTTPTFSWEAVTGSLYYRIRIFDYNRNIIYKSELSPTTTATVDPNILQPDNPYYWRVEVFDAATDPQNSSATWECPFYVAEDSVTSAISGQVWIDPNTTGYASGDRIFISAFDAPPPWSEDQLIGMTAISDIGAYTLYNMSIDTNIYIGALWDKDGSECYTVGDWAGAYYSNPVVLIDGNMSTNIDIYLVSEVQAASVSGDILCNAFDPNIGAVYIFAYDGPYPPDAHLLECAPVTDPNNPYTLSNLPVDSYAYLFALWDKDGNIDPNQPEYVFTPPDYNGGYTGNPLLVQGGGHSGIDIPIVHRLSFAITSGLQWLRQNQDPNGCWSIDEYTLGTTEFAALAFLNYGYDETDPNVAAAINFILSHVRQSDGAISEGGTGGTRDWVDNYTTAIGVMALTAADKYNDPPKYTQVISNAVQYLLNIQHTEASIDSNSFDQTDPAYGGWGYGQPDYSGENIWADLSNSQWDMLALREAKGSVDPNIVTGADIDDALSKALIFAQRCQNRPATNDLPWAHDPNNFSHNDGGFIYNPGSANFITDPWSYSSYDTMTYAGIWGLYSCGVPIGDPRMGDALNWAHNNFTVDPHWRGSHALYYTYYTMSKALTIVGNAANTVTPYWFGELFSQLINVQETDGSWINTDHGEGEGIQALTTSYALLSLATQAPSETAILDITIMSPATLSVTTPSGVTVVGDPNNVSFGVGSVQYGTYIIDLEGISDGNYALNVKGQDGAYITTESSTKAITNGETHRYDLVVWPGIGLDLELRYTGSTIPFMEITRPKIENEEADDLYMIAWWDSDLDDNATIHICYDDDTNEANGYLGEISPVGGIEEDTHNFLDWDVSGLAPGAAFYIYGTIADSNTTMTAWSPGTVSISPDGMPKDWEGKYGLDPYRPDGDGDLDEDNMSNLEEYEYKNIDPNGRSTNPRNWDTDGDGLPDGFEALAGDVNVLNPNEWDTDNDSVSDGDGDPDNDGFSNWEEFMAGTDPTDPNSRPPIEYPVVVSVIPSDKSVRVPVDTSIVIQFNMQMDRQSVESNVEIEDGYENPVQGQFLWTTTVCPDDTVIFMPDHNLTYSQSYEIDIRGGCEDAVYHYGLNGYREGEETHFATVGAPWDDSAPEVMTVIPYAGQVGGDMHLIGAFFSKPIDPNTIAPYNCNLAGPGINDPNDYTLEVNFEPYGIFIKPKDPLTPYADFNVTFTTGITDTEGHPLGSEYSWGFNAGEADPNSPYITQTMPVDGAANASPWAPVKVYFSENMDPDTVDDSTVTVYDETAHENKNIYIGKELEDGDRSKIVIRPVFEDGQWTVGHSYTVNIAGTVADLAGNTLGSDYALTFTVDPNYAPEVWPDECQGIKKPDGSTMIELSLWVNGANGNQNINVTATDLTQTGNTWNLINEPGDGKFIYESQGDEGLYDGYHEIEFQVTDTVNGQITQVNWNLYIFNTSPVIVYPDNGDYGISLTPDLSWDTNGIVHDDNYEIVIFDGPDPEAARNVWRTPIIADGSPNYTVTVPPCRALAPSTQYYWAVVAQESHNWSQGHTHSQLYSFTTTYQEVCNEDDSGHLDIKGSSGFMGGLVVIPVRVQSAPNEVSSFGFEFNYNPYVLEYTGFIPGECVASFDQFNVSQPDGPGMLRIGGFSANNPMPMDSNCALVNLEFTVVGGAAQGATSMLWLGNLKDDIAAWSTSIGCFTCGGCDGDLNKDGMITPRDALCAFQTYLGICPTSCGPCDQMCCDVNLDNECTPADALCIFRKYLGIPSCLDML